MLFSEFTQVRQTHGKAQGWGRTLPSWPSVRQQSRQVAVAGNNFVANLTDQGCNFKHARSFNNSREMSPITLLYPFEAIFPFSE